jgi:hypothetical protein
MLLGILLLCMWGAPLSRAEDEAGARKVAEAWLAIHDAGRHGETWDASAKLVQDKIPREQWEKAMRAATESFGALKSRTVLSSSAVRELPGMPDGEYVVLTYRSSFEHKAQAVETIIPMLEDGTWKVMTYRVR